MRAAKVAAVTDVGHDRFAELVEIHAAPEWLWSALVAAMVKGGWSVEQTRIAVRLEAVFRPPAAAIHAVTVARGRGGGPVVGRRRRNAHCKTASRARRRRTRRSSDR